MMAIRFQALFGIAMLLLSIPDAHATGNACSLSGATATSIGNYNPFTGPQFDQVSVNLNLTRYVGGGGHKTSDVDFYLVQPTGSPAGVDIRYQGSSVLYTLPATHPLRVPNGPAGTVYYDFGGNAKPDTVPFTFAISLPTGLDLGAGQPIKFDIVYICRGTGGLQDVQTPTSLPQAITLNINVQSALQASYAGPVFNFGEIGVVTDTQATSHIINGAIRVASSGPYAVSIASTNGYRMTYPGGQATTTTQSVGYSVRLLGQTHMRTQPLPNPVACIRAGTGGALLPITATLQEGGVSKTPAPNYRDTITITVTPLAVPYGGGPLDCGSLQ